MANPIQVWRYEEAPERYQNLSSNGGDEDWIAFIPMTYLNNHDGLPFWMESGSRFGCCNVQEIDVDGGKICIGSHS